MLARGALMSHATEETERAAHWAIPSIRLNEASGAVTHGPVLHVIEDHPVMVMPVISKTTTMTWTPLEACREAR